MLKIALPKGRVSQEALEKFNAILDDDFKFSFNERELISKNDNYSFLSLRNQDVPTFVNRGDADLGIVGLDVLIESNKDVIKLLDLQIAKCKLCVAGIKGKEIDYSKPVLKVATKHTTIAKNHFAKKAVVADFIKLNGSIELAPLIGASDVIVDIVQSGQTLKENGLEVKEDIINSSAYLIANYNSYYKHKKEILQLRDKLANI